MREKSISSNGWLVGTRDLLTYSYMDWNYALRPIVFYYITTQHLHLSTKYFSNFNPSKQNQKFIQTPFMKFNPQIPFIFSFEKHIDFKLKFIMSLTIMGPYKNNMGLGSEIKNKIFYSVLRTNSWFATN